MYCHCCDEGGGWRGEESRNYAECNPSPVYPRLADIRERGHGALTLAAPTNDGY